METYYKISDNNSEYIAVDKEDILVKLRDLIFRNLSEKNLSDIKIYEVEQEDEYNFEYFEITDSFESEVNYYINEYVEKLIIDLKNKFENKTVKLQVLDYNMSRCTFSKQVLNKELFAYELFDDNIIYIKVQKSGANVTVIYVGLDEPSEITKNDTEPIKQIEFNQKITDKQDFKRRDNVYLRRLKAFMDISVKKLCNERGINPSNFYNGRCKDAKYTEIYRAVFNQIERIKNGKYDDIPAFEDFQLFEEKTKLVKKEKPIEITQELTQEAINKHAKENQFDKFSKKDKELEKEYLKQFEELEDFSSALNDFWAEQKKQKGKKKPKK